MLWLNTVLFITRDLIVWACVHYRPKLSKHRAELFSERIHFYDTAVINYELYLYDTYFFLIIFETFCKCSMRRLNFILCQFYMILPLLLYPPPYYRQCIFIFAVAKGWLLLDDLFRSCAILAIFSLPGCWTALQIVFSSFVFKCEFLLTLRRETDIIRL